MSKKQTISFTDLMESPLRKQAETFLARTVRALEYEHDVPHALLAEVLFEFALIEMEPDSPITSEFGYTWAGQLHRFRDALQSRIDAMEAVYADEEK